MQPTLDRLYHGITLRLLEILAPAPGEDALDIGGAASETTRQLAARVAPGGRVLGVDISDGLARAGRDALAAAGLTNAEIVVADAQTYPFPPAQFDVVSSRFGVMFFADPVAAFANIARAMRPGGRLAFAAWGDFAGNPWFHVPRDAAIARLGPSERAAPREPGPFAFETLDDPVAILTAAGLTAVRGRAETIPLVTPGTPRDAAAAACALGPASAIMRQYDGGPDDLAAIEATVAEAFVPYAADGAVAVPATLNVLEARAPG
ncbi:class I SAM-dependent methyltransferase [Acuticoccus sp. I52.16.1]|uniref:class I SAM-dependent methyltransferase n=1 Tax=Acuticoccus sp. I52.16.1 TaxID=2928472 RepID=UPI001FD42426|nr:class I SAM-dependent methyltransferase [Acuticoccus sp. I52.16.1]UOM35583.1 class I SAM-dependent methyltransferase [Acuticoccus sp. I52.16.1]